MNFAPQVIIVMSKIYTAVLALFISATCFAQEDSVNIKSLGEVFVTTGQYKPQSVKNSVYQVRVISQEQIKRQAPAKLQDVLNNQLNIRFAQDPATGGSDISMMGLSGQNVKILIDGVPVIGRQGTSNEINVNQIDVNTVERIEIIEGPMSVMYGADALAGVINIITKKSLKEKYSVQTRIQEETVGDEYGSGKGIHNQFLGASATYKKWYASGGIGHNLFNGWKDTATGRELVWHKKDQITGNAVLGYRNEKLNVYYRLDGLDEIITNPANISGNQPAIDQDYMTNRLMQQIQATYQFHSALTASALASYTHFTRQVYSTLYYPNGDKRLAPAGYQSLSTVNGFNFRGNVVYKLSSNISFQPGVDINLESGEGERVKEGVQRIDDYAFYITSEITPNKNISIRPGLRFIHNSFYDAPPVIPAINTRFNLGHGWDMRLAYAYGFRAPSIRELYFDFFDASHSIKGNQNLQAEHSHSYTGSLTWSRKQYKNTKLKFTLNGFYNDVSNMIDYITDANDPSVTTYGNIAVYKTTGGTLNAQLICHNLDAQLGFGYTGRYNQYATADKDLPEFKWSPEITSIIAYSFPKIGLDLNLYYKLTGKLPYYQAVTNNGQTEIQLIETEGYQWADFTVNKRIASMFTISGGVRNLFDVTAVNNVATGGVHSNNSSRPIGYGRSYFLGLAFNWAKAK